jgi:hypothetical protein
LLQQLGISNLLQSGQAAVQNVAREIAARANVAFRGDRR